MSAHVDRSDWSAWENAGASFTFAGLIEEIARSEVGIGFGIVGFGNHGDLQMLMPVDVPARLLASLQAHVKTLCAYCEAFYNAKPRTVPDYGMHPITELEHIAYEVARCGVTLRIVYDDGKEPKLQISFTREDCAEIDTLSLLIRRNQVAIKKLLFAFEEFEDARQRGEEFEDARQHRGDEIIG
jgi:hypothetical protein